MKLLFSLLVILALNLCAASAQSVVFIVRHAEKADSTKDPELSDAGRARAESLAKMLKDSNVTAIYATEFKRTQETAAPLAKILGVTVTTLPAQNGDELTTSLRASNDNSLVIGHGNTIPDLIKALGISEPINIAENDYDNLFVVILSERPRLIRLHYPG